MQHEMENVCCSDDAGNPAIAATVCKWHC